MGVKEATKEIIMQYPKRPAFFANKFCRILTKSAAAMELGTGATLMLMVIAQQEDSKRYTGPVLYWNSQLGLLCGFIGSKRLTNARQAAIDAGWLAYTPGRRGKAGKYWVMIPERYSNLNDGPCDEMTDELEVELTNETSTQQDRGHVLTSQNGLQSNLNRTSIESQSNLKGQPFIPIPKPSSSPLSTEANACLSATKEEDDLDWKILEEKIFTLGIGKATEIVSGCRRRECKPSQVSKLIEWWERKKSKLGIGALYTKLKCFAPDQSISANWPEPKETHNPAKARASLQKQTDVRAADKAERDAKKSKENSETLRLEGAFGAEIDSMSVAEVKAMLKKDNSKTVGMLFPHVVKGRQVGMVRAALLSYLGRVGVKS